MTLTGYSADDFKKLNTTLTDFQSSHGGRKYGCPSIICNYILASCLTDFPDFIIYNKAAFANCDEFGINSSLTGIDLEHQGNDASKVEEGKGRVPNKAGKISKRNEKPLGKKRKTNVDPKAKKTPKSKLAKGSI